MSLVSKSRLDHVRTVGSGRGYVLSDSLGRASIGSGPRAGRLDVLLRQRLVRLYWSLFRPKSLGIRAIVADDRGRILLVRHTYDPRWYLPGGGVDRNESAKDAIVRELREEIGLECPAVDRILGVYHSRTEGKDDHVVVVVLTIASAQMDRLRITDPREIAEIAIVPLDALPEGTSPATRRRIAEHVSGAQAVGSW
jgi:ADP-ribose pyrophosphatase YjhB (NUDIX family)